ncbi:NAD(P)-dependent dehydrogenase, short-chain alcohol dehydrogenase family [Singulisphaera sp. GP187]|uniref:SDR family oxidoreductase n=1 Tax=Singulisphaera sp. GP187 TaxID=1882752 RepID=UPI000928C48E|nr:SDR family oxidoreductase [Singulisphaera sp. GP187]SIN93469.1 NAD(P)-dependent dehydrogenase, short-chain alcohol dehydrogenase family [Singulisphaera sp. GP187]
MLNSKRSMAGKVCLVTGATSGIGEITARALAEQGANLTIVGRSQERCIATLDRIRRSSLDADVDFILADLSSQESIRHLAALFRERKSRLDLLINNAGALFFERHESVDGIELTFALNHLAYFQLTILLLDLLLASPPSRVVNVASEAHRSAGKIPFDDLEGRKRYRGFRAYAQSKLANLLFTFELARRLEGTHVTANALHPGLVATNIFAGNGIPGWLLRRGASLFAISPEKGAETSIYLGSSPEVSEVSGRYFYRQKPIASSRASHDPEVAGKLWERSAELTQSFHPLFGRPKT